MTLKKMIIKIIFPVFSMLNRFIEKRAHDIFIYCANDDLSDNSKALFEYLIDNGYHKKYRIICGVKKPWVYEKERRENVFFIPRSRCVWQYMKSGHVFYSFGKIPIKPTNSQCVVNLWHGIPLKTIGKLANIDNGDEFFFTYVCAPSEMYRPIMAKAFGCPEENICICGEPKTDHLFEEKKIKENKLIVWLPTFRKSKYLGYNDSDDDSILPMFKENEWDELNQVLRQNNVKLVAKLHPLQDIYDFTYVTMSNLSVFSDVYFKKIIGNLYSLLSQSDALISDYSSVCLEYLVLDRPICFTLGDMDEYICKRGFVFENPLKFMPGEQIKEKTGLYKFIYNVTQEVDYYKVERKNVNNMVNQYKDGGNCKRILEISGITL